VLSLSGSEKKRSEGMDWPSFLSFGFFLILLGIFWINNPGIEEKIIAFIRDFHLENVIEKIGGPNIVFPVPGNLYDHVELYAIARQFCLIQGSFQIVMLALRFVFRDSQNRKAETISNIVFWFGEGFFINMLLNQTIGWFGFFAGFVMTIGVSIVVSSFLRLFR
jgi:hypothetical protein